ncbi:MAG TPA: hypothetical protein VK502_04075 [Candidatus Saccharimonadales bacterium]|nr:hypothetical protein [Candidatus Saccharimonadales bacterium]
MKINLHQLNFKAGQKLRIGRQQMRYDLSNDRLNLPDYFKALLGFEQKMFSQVGVGSEVDTQHRGTIFNLKRNRIKPATSKKSLYFLPDCLENFSSFAYFRYSTEINVMSLTIEFWIHIFASLLEESQRTYRLPFKPSPLYVSPLFYLQRD